MKKIFHVVWNPRKTEGFITDDEDDAEFVRSGFRANAAVSTPGEAFREAYSEGEDDEETELPAQTVELEV